MPCFEFRLIISKFLFDNNRFYESLWDKVCFEKLLNDSLFAAIFRRCICILR